jgi:hypothetical protein
VNVGYGVVVLCTTANVPLAVETAVVRLVDASVELSKRAFVESYFSSSEVALPLGALLRKAAC